MCRSLANGGRRCPCTTDPVKRAAYNARRRELRQAQKLGLPTPPINKPVGVVHNVSGQDTNTSHSSPTVSPKFTQNRNRLNSISHNILGHIPENKRTVTRKEPVSNSRLATTGVYYTQNEGALAEWEFVHSMNLHGTIDRTKLDKHSYKDFGFTNDFSEYYNTNGVYADDFDEALCETYSAHEHKNIMEQLENDGLDPEAIDQSLIGYSSYTYEGINEALYHQATITNEELSDYAVTKEDVIDETRNLDAFLSASPKYYKKRYRIIGGDSELFLKYKDSNDPIEEWINDKNLRVGSTAHFDGYLSTTGNKKVLTNFSNTRSAYERSVIFEIVTPEGANISSISDFPDENETLLPRDTSYVVVGKHTVKKDGTGQLHIIQMVATDKNGTLLDEDNVHTPSPLLWEEKGNLKN